MKKEKDLQEIIKAAVLEALVEFTNGGIAMMAEGDNTGEEGGDGEGGTGNEGGTGDLDEDGDGDGGKKKDPIEPPVIWPPAGFSLRNK